MRAAIVLASVLALQGCLSQRVEEPAYSVRLSEGSFELREYAATIVAETTVQGGAWDARFEGFGPLADYIFAKDRQGKKIAMTAPVTQAPREPIAMTAPVTETRDGAGGWTIAFTMPSHYSMKTLPAPSDPNVKLVEKPSRTMAVLGFTGLATNTDMDAASHRLEQRIASEGLTVLGKPVFAFYDPPWTLPFLRRNEVMIEVSTRS